MYMKVLIVAGFWSWCQYQPAMTFLLACVCSGCLLKPAGWLLYIGSLYVQVSWNSESVGSSDSWSPTMAFSGSDSVFRSNWLIVNCNIPWCHRCSVFMCLVRCSEKRYLGWWFGGVCVCCWTRATSGTSINDLPKNASDVAPVLVILFSHVVFFMGFLALVQKDGCVEMILIISLITIIIIFSTILTMFLENSWSLPCCWITSRHCEVGLVPWHLVSWDTKDAYPLRGCRV